MNPANCGCSLSASLLPAEHNLIIDYHVKVTVRYMQSQYNIVNCKVAMIWFILCHRLLPIGATVKRGRASTG